MAKTFNVDQMAVGAGVSTLASKPFEDYKNFVIGQLILVQINFFFPTRRRSRPPLGALIAVFWNSSTSLPLRPVLVSTARVLHLIPILADPIIPVASVTRTNTGE